MYKQKFSKRINRLFSITLRVLPVLALMLAASQANYGLRNALAAAPFSVSMTDSLFTDVNGNTQANGGDTLAYAVTVTNSSGADKTNVQFSNTIDSHTTLVGGSVKTTPVARNDSGYSTVGNVPLTVPVGQSLLLNDNDPDGSGAVTLTGITGCVDVTAPFVCAGVTTESGDVTLNADGSFTYNPAPGFSGTDSFTYSVQDTDTNTDSATVSIAVGQVVWFINNSLAPAGDGRFTSPFNSIANFNALAVDEPGDYIFVYHLAGSYTGAITLLNTQQLIGHAEGLTISPNLSISAGTRPTLANIALASGNTVRGLNVIASSGTGISGASVGALTINNVAVTNSGGAAVSLASGTLAVTLDSVSSTSGTNGILLSQVGGSFTSNGGTIQSATGHGIQASNTSAGPLNFTLTNSTVTANGTNGINFDVPSGSGSFGNITITSNTITNNVSTGLRANIQGTGSIGKIDIGSNTFSGTSGSPGLQEFGVDLATNGTASIDFDIHNNTTMTGDRTQINIAANDLVHNNGTGPTMEGYIRNNTITLNPADVGIAVWVVSDGDGNITVDISGNVVTGFGDSGIDVESRGGTGDVHARIVSNVASTTAVFPLAGLFARSGNGTAGETSLLCVNVSGNNMNGGAGAVADYYQDRFTPATTVFQIQGLSPTPATTAQTSAYIVTTDSAPPATSYTETGSYVAATCSTVSFAAIPSGSQLASGTRGTASVSVTAPNVSEIFVTLKNSASRWTSGLLSTFGVSTAYASGETVNVTLGTLNHGQIVTITYRVNIDNPVTPPSTTQISNQGAVTGDGGLNVLTDDPDAGGATDPTITLLADEIPPDTSFTSTPTNPSNNPTPSFQFGGTDNVTAPGSLTFECKLDLGGFSACTSPHGTGALGEGSHTFQVRAKDAALNVDASPDSYTWVIDLTVPNTTINSQPPNPGNDSTPTFTFSGDDGTGSGVAGFFCKMDGGSANPCTSPFTSSALADGSHTFYVFATDNATNEESSPASYTWTVDATAPDTTITSNPTTPTSSTSASFSFTGNDGTGVGGITFTCDLDGGGFSACTSPQNYSSLGAGSHTFQVRAIDSLGNSDATPASFTWSIDLAAPNTSINSNPPNPSNDSTPTFTFSGTDDATLPANLTFECQVDSGGFSVCTSPHTTAALAAGPHTFDVRAVDAVLNVDASPASYTWTIDLTAPDVTINQAAGQSDPTSATTINFTVVFNESVTGFGDNVSDVTVGGTAGATTAIVTGGPSTYNVAVSGMTLSGTVIVSIPASSASDAAGNGNNASTSADNSVTWVPDATPPDTTINSNPANPSISNDAAFTFSGTDDQTLPGALTFECQLDSGGFSACVSPQNYIGLSVGNHTFDVRARDQANNVDATPATYTWEVITGPIATVVNGVCRPALPVASQLNFVLFDPEGDTMTLKLVSNTNTILVPNRFIIIRGVGTARTVTIGATPNRTGVSTITLEVSDGVHSTPIVINFQVGTNGIDTLNGTSGIDVIIGQNGNDTLTGGAGNDLLCGGLGNDTLNGDDGNDILDGSAGNDILNGGADNDILRGFSGIDTLTGGLGADFFSGGIGVDILTDYTVLEGDTKDWLSP